MTEISHDKNWFTTWFNTDYYHTLYANRDEKEAELFIRNLISHLSPNPEKAHFLDLACGKGRHSYYMNQLGFRVTGVDLADNSISLAKKWENDRLKFAVQDMREPLNAKFTHIFNLFTSFGYFDSIAENQKVMHAIDAMTESGSVMVFDYLNAVKVRATLVPEEQKTLNDIQFNITRKTDDHHVFKYIHVVDGEKEFNYMERVQLLGLTDFTKLLESINFEVSASFGDFNLAPFDANHSDRLILIARKK